MRQSFCPVDIVFKSVKKCDEIIKCYFCENLNAAFQVIYNEDTKIKHCSAWKCYCCSNYYRKKYKFILFEIAILRIVPVACYVYHFNMQSLLTFEENFKYKEIFPWLLILILKLQCQPLNPNLNIECSFSRLDLTRDQLDFKDNKTFFQLEDCVFAVAVKNSKFAISVMFTTDLKFAADCLLNWFNKEFKSNSLELKIWNWESNWLVTRSLLHLYLFSRN